MDLVGVKSLAKSSRLLSDYHGLMELWLSLCLVPSGTSAAHCDPAGPDRAGLGQGAAHHAGCAAGEVGGFCVAHELRPSTVNIRDLAQLCT